MTEWFNENELRSYPIREDLQRLASSGEVLPNSVIADISVVVDADSAADVHVSSVGITPSLVSVSISAGGEGVLVATIENPVVHQPYRLEPLVEDVSGFVVFGNGIKVSAPKTYAFPDDTQSRLEFKAVHPFETAPVTSIGKAGAIAEPLTGLINLAVDDDFEFRRDGNTIYIGLKEGVRPLYVGPCDRIIDYITCGRPPLRAINGVGPDADGIITIEVQ